MTRWMGIAPLNLLIQGLWQQVGEGVLCLRARGGDGAVAHLYDIVGDGVTMVGWLPPQQRDGGGSRRGGNVGHRGRGSCWGGDGGRG